jgi:hypothetical protein
MKYKVTVAIVSVLYVIYGCNSKQQTDVSVPVIDIVEGIEDEGTKMLLSEVAEDITFIPLETTDECLIGFIESIHFSKNYNYIVIIGSEPNQILLFDKTGKFIRKIGSKGQGPGEYLYPRYAILVDDELFVWDLFLNTTFCYNVHTGKCLREKKHDAYYEINDMECLKDSLLVYYYSCPDNEDMKDFFRIHTLSLDFKNENMLWQAKYQSQMNRDEPESCHAITYIKDGYYYVWDFGEKNGTVFCMNENFEKTPAYQLYLGNYTSYNRTAGERFSVYSIRETDRFLIITGALEEKRHARRILYDKTTGKCSKNIIFNLDFHDWGFHNDIDGSIPFWPSGYISQNVLYDCITPERLKELMSHPYYKTIEVKDKEKHQAIKDYLDSAEEDANPIIFIATMKTK